MHAVSAVPATMTAWRQTEYGSADVVRAETVPVPVPAGDEVLVHVSTTGLNSADVRVMSGTPSLIRLAFGLRRPRTATQGRDVCGTVAAVGSNVTEWQVGDEVVGEIAGGGLAQFVAAPAARFVRRSRAVDPVDAAAVPMAGGTAMQALDIAEVTEGRRVLVVGAGGGVGTFAVRLAVLRGAQVWALSGQRTEALLRELGAQQVFDYRTTGAGELDPDSFDAVIDIAGTAPLADLSRLLRPGGTVVLVSGGGDGVLGPIPRILAAIVRSRRSRRLRALAASPRPEMTAELLELVESGRLRPVIEQVWTFEEARSALASVADGHTVGKAVVRVSGGSSAER